MERDQPENMAGMPLHPQGTERGFGDRMVCNTQDREKGTSDDRKRELMNVAIGIAAQVKAFGIRGRERCMLRSMVEMFLEE